MCGERAPTCIAIHGPVPTHDLDPLLKDRGREIYLQKANILIEVSQRETQPVEKVLLLSLKYKDEIDIG